MTDSERVSEFVEMSKNNLESEHGMCSLGQQ